MLLQIINKAKAHRIPFIFKRLMKRKTWTENTPIAEDGKQIWAVIHESKIIISLNRSRLNQKKAMNIRLIGDHHMALSKTGVIVYNKTVGNLNGEAKSHETRIEYLTIGKGIVSTSVNSYDGTSPAKKCYPQN